MYTKMKSLKETMEIPENVKVTKEGSSLVISGPNGEIRRNFNNPRISVAIKNNELIMTSNNASKSEKAIIHTYKAHIKNAFKGSKENFVYKLKICSGHFPMNVTVSENKLIIKNFIGEKVPRTINLKPGANVKVEGNMITVEGPDKELTGQVAADIEQATRRPGYDKRIFQDGIYIIDKAGKVA